MNNATEQIFLPSSSGTQDQLGLPKPGNGPQPVNLDSVQEFSKVCRVCAAVSELVMPIFSGEGLQNNLADKIHKHLPIKVSESDSPGLPVVVCYQCASTLLATHELVQCAAQADAALRTRSAALAADAARRLQEKEESLRAAQERNTSEGTSQCPPSPTPFSEDSCRDSSDDDRPLATLAAERPTDRYDAFYAALLNFRNHFLGEHGARAAYPEFTESSEESTAERAAVDPELLDDLSGGNMRVSRLDANTRLALARARGRAGGRVWYSCGTCGKRLSSAHTFVFHCRIHTGERPCVCHVCGKQFRAPNGLQRHVAETHERRRRRACRHCARTFANSQNLKQHLRTHTGERPHACALCPARFAHAGSLHAHRRTHEPARPHRCARCPAAFRLRAGLARHAHRHTHASAPPPPPPPPAPPKTRSTERRCAFCPERLPRQQYRAHLERRHAALVFHCDECDRYLSRRVLLLHMTAHAAHYDAAAQEAARRDRPDLPPPDPTPAQQLASALQSLLFIAPGVRAPFPPVLRLEPPVKTEQTDAPVKTETLIRPELPNGTEDDIENKNAQSIPPAIPATPDLTRTSISSPAPFPPTSDSNPVIVLSAVTVPTPATALPAIVTASLPETTIAPTSIRDEFSDHSDAESEFGPLPDSVFSAIEDPPDVIPSPAKDKEAEADKAGRKRERACPHCDKKYSAASSYFYHLKYFHLGSREHACTVCGASFGTRGTLREHERLHSPERSLQCACGKRFRSKAGLYIHSQTHGGGKAKTWSCRECGRAFRWHAQLRRHAARHAGARAHECPQPQCPRAFSVRADMLRHARTHTHPATRLACPTQGCTATFAQPRYLRAHLTKKHPAAT